jgi:hypothetical protein
MPTPQDKAKEGVLLIEEAILDLLSIRGDWMARAEIARQLDIESTYLGKSKGHLSGAILDSLRERALVERQGYGRNEISYYRIPSVKP